MDIFPAGLSRELVRYSRVSLGPSFLPLSFLASCPLCVCCTGFCPSCFLSASLLSLISFSCVLRWRIEYRIILHLCGFLSSFWFLEHQEFLSSSVSFLSLYFLTLFRSVLCDDVLVLSGFLFRLALVFSSVLISCALLLFLSHIAQPCSPVLYQSFLFVLVLHPFPDSGISVPLDSPCVYSSDQ